MRKLVAALIAALLVLLAAPAFGDLPPPCGAPALELAWQQNEMQYKKTATCGTIWSLSATLAITGQYVSDGGHRPVTWRPAGGARR